LVDALVYFRLVTQGFHLNPSSNRSSVASDSSLQQAYSILPRVQVSGPLLIELLHIVYHGAERCANGAMQALHDIIQRATYDTFPGAQKSSITVACYLPIHFQMFC